MNEQCPCCSGKRYTDCCGVFIEGKKLPSTPEELMRSRYTAYTQANIEYIIRTMKSPASDHFDPVDAREWAQQVHWLKLDVLSTSIEAKKGYVEFIAYFSQEDKKTTLHEVSEFHYENDTWFYVDGQVSPSSLPIRSSHVGRNDPCPCGSGKKYKKCCGG